MVDSRASLTDLALDKGHSRRVLETRVAFVFILLILQGRALFDASIEQHCGWPLQLHSAP